MCLKPHVLESHLIRNAQLVWKEHFDCTFGSLSSETSTELLLVRNQPVRKLVTRRWQVGQQTGVRAAVKTLSPPIRLQKKRGRPQLFKPWLMECWKWLQDFCSASSAPHKSLQLSLRWWFFCQPPGYHHLPLSHLICGMHIKTLDISLARKLTLRWG